MRTILEHLRDTSASGVPVNCGTAECGLCVVLADDVPCLACVTPSDGITSIDELPNIQQVLRVGSSVLQRLACFRAASAQLQKRLWLYRWAFALSDRCRVVIIGDYSFLTDSLSRYSRGRHGVFPFIDESTRLLEWLTNVEVSAEPFDLIDPFAGCGTICLAANGKVVRRCGIEINPRAIIYARQNAAINGVEAKFLCANALEDVAWSSEINLDRKCVIIANPPFSPSPSEFLSTLPTASRGGDDGLYNVAGMLRIGLDALRDFTFGLMCYSLVGQAGVHVVKSLATLDAEKRLGSIRWEHFPGAKMWRVGDEKVARSPLALSEVPRLAKGLSLLSNDADDLAIGWERWVQRYTALGYNELQFGIVTNINPSRCLRSGSPTADNTTERQNPG